VGIVLKKETTQQEEDRAYNHAMHHERTLGNQCVFLVEDGYPREIQRFRDLHDLYLFSTDAQINELCYKHAINSLVNARDLA
jgi:hypothetical protein